MRACLLISSSCDHAMSLRPADRLVRDPQRSEDLVVEAVLAEQQRVDALEELARLRALDDPVVVRRGERHHPADGVAADGVVGCPLVLRRVLHRADPDDRALTPHQPRHRVVRADGARVGEGHRRTGEVLDRELGVAGLAHDVLVAGPERGEVHGLGALDVGHEELAGAVLLLHVDGQAEVDVGRGDLGGLAVDDVEADVHLGHGLQGLDQRVADQVGERHLAAARAREVVVDDDPVVPEQLDRDGPDRRGRGDAQRVVHVRDRARRGAAQHGVRRLVDRGGRLGGLRLLRHGAVGALRGLGRLGLGPRRRLRCGSAVGLGRRRRGGLLDLPGGRWGGLGRCRGGGGARGRGGPVAGRAAVAVLGEVRRPRGVHAARVARELFVHLLDEPFVGSEVGGGAWLRGGGVGRCGLLLRHGCFRLFRNVRVGIGICCQG